MKMGTVDEEGRAERNSNTQLTIAEEEGTTATHNYEEEGYNIGQG